MKKIFALVVLLCAVMISSTAAAAANWVWIYSDEDYTIYVDKNSIRRDYNYPGYVFRAFVRWIFTETGRQKKLEQCRSLGIYLSKKCYDLSSMIYLEYFKEINGLKYTCTTKVISHDSEGNYIPELSVSKDTLNWNVITPDSVGEAIFDNIQARVPN